MTGRREFLKLGALFVPAVVAPRIAYSFLWDRQEPTLPRASFCGLPFPEPPQPGETFHVTPELSRLVYVFTFNGADWEMDSCKREAGPRW